MKTACVTLVAFCSVALALSAMARPGADAQPETKPPLQKSPVLLPADALLPTSLPATKWNELPVVTASINTSLVESVVVDTGLNANVVLPNASTRLALSPLTSKTRLNVFNLQCIAQESQIQRLRAKSLELKDVSVAVADLPALLSQHPQPNAPAVWFGTPFLSAFQVTFDPSPNSISITLEKPRAPFPHSRDMAVAPLVMQDGRPFVKVSIPGAKSFLALVDTGSPGTVIPTEVGEKLKLKPIKSDLSAGKQGKAARIEVPKLNIGKAEWKAAQVLYITSDTAKEFDRGFAVLGMDFLSRFKVSLNYSRLQIAFTPPAKPDDTSGQPAGETEKPQ